MPKYATISSAFLAKSELRVELINNGLGGFKLIEEPVVPYLKYDDDNEAEVIINWPKEYVARDWGIFMAFNEKQPMGGSMVAIDIPAGMTTPFEDSGIAILWDLRVSSESRNSGIGSMLFKYASDWARQKGCKQLKIETQNVNVPACRFYAKQGCVLGGIHRYGYAGCADVAHESMLLWYLNF